MTTPRSRRTVKRWRDGTLFGCGLAGIFYETVFQSADRPTLLLLFGTMVGLPAYLGYDESRRRRDDDEDH